MTVPIVPIPTAGAVAGAPTLMRTPPVALSFSNEQAPPESRAFVTEQHPSQPNHDPASSDSWIGTSRVAILALWFAGALFVLVRSLAPVLRFERLLRSACRPATPEAQRLANATARRFGFRSSPPIHTVSTQIAPLVWWIGGRVRIVIPEVLVKVMDSSQLQLVLAHEFAHIKRRDHLVRWLEWLACVTFWWTPLAWWARRNLRINEEICCDALVLRTFNTDPREYAGSLMHVLEFLASPAIRPPVR